LDAPKENPPFTAPCCRTVSIFGASPFALDLILFFLCPIVALLVVVDRSSAVK